MADDIQNLEIALDSLRELLEHWKKMGRRIDVSPAALDALRAGGGGPFALQPDQASSPKPESTVVEELAEPCESLKDIEAWMGDCRRCPLHEKRTQIVFGVGNPNAQLMFIGEGPGRDEDLQGIPFVGAAGKLLTRMIEGGLKKSREDVYITNIVKCRPPGNRDPQPDEARACRRFLTEQVRLIQPKVICALGRVAAHNLLETDKPISRLRGTWHDFHGTRVMPTFHPAALLRNAGYKRPAWEDLQAVMAELGWTTEDGKETE